MKEKKKRWKSSACTTQSRWDLDRLVVVWFQCHWFLPVPLANNKLLSSWMPNRPDGQIISYSEKRRSETDDKLKTEIAAFRKREGTSMTQALEHWAAVERTMRERKLVFLTPLMRNDKQVVTCLSFDQEHNILLLQDWGMKAVVALAFSDGRLGGKQKAAKQWALFQVNIVAKDIIPIRWSDAKLILWPCERAFLDSNSRFCLSHCCGLNIIII